MSQKFQASIQQRGDVSYVKLGGVIDEDNELADLVERIPSGTALIDVGEIERINSCGVRDWVNWLGKLDSQGAKSVLVECSPAIVAQINLVNNFTGTGVVKSFYVPYFCPECDEEKVLLVETSEMGPPPHEPPTCRCDECDLVMDFDDMPDSYFAFLSNNKKIAEPDRLNGAMKEMAPASITNKSRTGNGSNSKVKARSSSPAISPAGSKPSVPSLPALGKGGVSAMKPTVSAAQLGQYQAQVRAAGKAPSQPPGAFAAAASSVSNQQQSAAASNKLVYVLIGLLILAIGVVAYLVSTK
jgi:anti-anti-sigma regulatory factor